MKSHGINFLRAASLLALGLGVGSSGTLLFLQGTSTTTPIPEAPAKQRRPEAALTTELLLRGGQSWAPAKRLSQLWNLAISVSLLPSVP